MALVCLYNIKRSKKPLRGFKHAFCRKSGFIRTLELGVGTKSQPNCGKHVQLGAKNSTIADNSHGSAHARTFCRPIMLSTWFNATLIKGISPKKVGKRHGEGVMCLLLDTVELPYCDGTPGQHGGRRNALTR